MSESMVPVPEDSYGIAKLAVEQELKATKEIFGMDYIIYRPHNVYGERQNIGDKYRNVIGIFMNQIMLGNPLSIFGDGDQKRAFSYIGDIAPVIARSVFDPIARNHIFNIGADEPYSVNELARAVSRSMGAELRVMNYPARNEVKLAYSDHEKAKKMLGYETRTSLQEGIDRMAFWAKKIGAKKSKEFDNIEIKKNLPDAWK
jgi:UDP-glucose 4-epimerase